MWKRSGNAVGLWWRQEPTGLDRTQATSTCLELTPRRSPPCRLLSPALQVKGLRRPHSEAKFVESTGFEETLPTASLRISSAFRLTTRYAFIICGSERIARSRTKASPCLF